MRPAEPSSVAVAATFHSLTRLLLHIIRTVRKEIPSSRVLHSWELNRASNIIVSFFRHVVKKKFVPGMKRSTSYTRKSITSSQHGRSVGHLDVGGVTLMNLSDGDIEDLHEMTSKNLLSDLIDIVGFDETGNPKESLLHNEIVHRGKVWAEHVKEPWIVLLMVGAYFIVSIGLGITFFVTIGTLIARGIYGGNEQNTTLRFSLLNTQQFFEQSVGWTLIGLVLQIMDAILFGYLVKIFTYGSRFFGGRPLWARIGKRTLVIVDTPMNHQLLENFVSKLFSQAYSFVSIDVHGASGLDHFVHRFTHRVVRGVLLAVGRPDGRMSTLAKSESAVLLAIKQAAFIQNPSYNGGAGSGVDIVTIGHNPFSPSMGKTCHSIYLPSVARHVFVDEYIYERLFLATKPFTGGILQSLSNKYKYKGQILQRMEPRRAILKEFKDILIHRDLTRTEAKREAFLRSQEEQDLLALADMANLPYGCCHIDPRYRGSDLLKDFIMSIPKDLFQALRKKIDETFEIEDEMDQRRGPQAVSQQDDASNVSSSKHSSIEYKSENQAVDSDGKGGKPERPGLSGCSNDPGVRLAFNQSLDSETQKVESALSPEQTFYECRIASIERYISFCVMFHAMAVECRAPLFRAPWDIARSQSNLRVATTASPISAADSTDSSQGHSKLSSGAQKFVKGFLGKLRHVESNF